MLLEFILESMALQDAMKSFGKFFEEFISIDFFYEKLLISFQVDITGLIDDIFEILNIFQDS